MKENHRKTDDIECLYHDRSEVVTASRLYAVDDTVNAKKGNCIEIRTTRVSIKFYSLNQN